MIAENQIPRWKHRNPSRWTCLYHELRPLLRFLRVARAGHVLLVVYSCLDQYQEATLTKSRIAKLTGLSRGSKVAPAVKELVHKGFLAIDGGEGLVTRYVRPSFAYTLAVLAGVVPHSELEEAIADVNKILSGFSAERFRLEDGTPPRVVRVEQYGTVDFLSMQSDPSSSPPEVEW